MTDFQPGDIVDITITGAKVTEILDDGGISIRVGSGDYLWLVPTADVTVVRRAPQPQPGDVWRLRPDRVVHITRDRFDNYELWAISPEDNRETLPISDVDFTDAELLFRLAVPVPADAEAVR